MTVSPRGVDWVLNARTTGATVLNNLHCFADDAGVPAEAGDLCLHLETLVRDRLAGWPASWEGYHWPGYTYEHTLRVRNLALELARREGGDEQVVELAALLHDIRKDAGRDHARIGAAETRGILAGLAVAPGLVDRVYNAIGCHSGDNTAESPVENRCLGDADLIDANFGLVAFWRFITIRSGYDTPVCDTVRSMEEWLPKKDELLGMLLTRSGREIARQRAQRGWAFWEELKRDRHAPPANGEYRLTDVIQHIHSARGGSYLEQQLGELEQITQTRQHTRVVRVVCRSLRAEIAGVH